MLGSQVVSLKGTHARAFVRGCSRMVVDEVMQGDCPAREGATGKDGVQKQLYRGDPAADGHGLYVAIHAEPFLKFCKLRLYGRIWLEL